METLTDFALKEKYERIAKLGDKLAEIEAFAPAKDGGYQTSARSGQGGPVQYLGVLLRFSGFVASATRCGCLRRKWIDRAGGVVSRGRVVFLLRTE